MSKILNKIEQTIGNTPLLRLSNIEKIENVQAKLIGKLEFLNPGGSIKDRVALQMINDGEKLGLIKEGTTIIEPTSGNTGIGLALVGSSRGYSVHIVMPNTMSIERQLTMKAYGAKLTLTDGNLGMLGAIEKAEELKGENDFIPAQFDNESNPKAHYLTTGPEIWNDTDGNIDILISAVGTGGTITGVGRYLKEKNPNIQIVAVEPKSSAVLSGEKKGRSDIQGIGAGFIPSILDLSIIDKIVKVSDEEAFEKGRLFGQSEGFLVGISSGAALAGALKIAKEEENKGKNIVIILPDSGDRYLSTKLYNQ